MKNIKTKKKNRGSSIAMVIAAIAMLSILASVVLTTTLMSAKMKRTYKESIENFYDAETAVAEIRMGLEGDISCASSVAYLEVMESYSASYEQNDQREANFVNAYQRELKNALADTNPAYYSLEHLEHFIDTERIYNSATGVGTVVSSDGDPILSVSTDGIVLKNLYVTYTNEEGYESSIRTDIAIGYPSFGFIQSNNSPDVLAYAVIAQEGIDADNGSADVNFEGNVFAGGEGLLVNANSIVNIAEDARVIVAGGLDVEVGARFTTGDNNSLWVDNLLFYDASTVELSGTIYVQDDMTLLGGADVRLSGSYYGYGNPNSASLSQYVLDSEINTGMDENRPDYSSCILINSMGTSKSKLNFTRLTSLMLAGNAYITSGDEETGITGSSMTGESIAIKASQIAYLVDPKYLAKRNEDGYSGYTQEGITNPSTEGDLVAVNLEDHYANDIFCLRNQHDGMCYYYYKFPDAASASAYIAKYYAEEDNAAQLEKDIALYVEDNEIQINRGSLTNKMLNGSILVWDKEGVSSLVPTFGDGTKDISDDSSLAVTQATWFDMYAAYRINLTTDYESLTEDEKERGVFDNLVDKSLVKGDSSFVTATPCEFTYTDSEGTHIAYVCKGDVDVTDGFVKRDGSTVEMIIASGDVTVSTSFEGTIICNGKVIFKGVGGGFASIRSNTKKTSLLLYQASVEKNGEEYFLCDFIKGADFIAGNTTEGNEDSTTIDMNSLIVYQNWSKE